MLRHVSGSIYDDLAVHRILHWSLELSSRGGPPLGDTIKGTFVLFPYLFRTCIALSYLFCIFPVLFPNFDIRRVSVRTFSALFCTFPKFAFRTFSVFFPYFNLFLGIGRKASHPIV